MTVKEIFNCFSLSKQNIFDQSAESNFPCDYHSYTFSRACHWLQVSSLSNGCTVGCDWVIAAFSTEVAGST